MSARSPSPSRSPGPNPPPSPLPDNPQNAALLELLRGRASRPRTGGVDDYGGYELRTHPDLISRLEELAPKRPILPVYGAAVLAHEGIAAVVALSMSHLLFRFDDVAIASNVAADLQRATPIPPLTDQGWHAVDAWQSRLSSAEGLRALEALTHAALEHARDQSAR